MAQRAGRVAISRVPVLDHAVAGELVVLRLNLIVLRAINEVHDLVDVAIGDGLQKLAVFGVEDFARHRFQHVGQCHPDALELLEMIRIGPRPARILDLFLSRADIVEIARQVPARAPQVDLERERVLAGIACHHPLQRGVGDEPAIPIELAVHLDGGTAGRQRAARHDVLGPDLVAGRIEIDEVAAADVDGADGKAHLAGVDAVEVDEPLERAAQRRGVVPAGGLDRARRREVRRRNARLEKAGSPFEQGRSGAELVEEDVTGIAAQPVMGDAEGVEQKLGRDLLPEGAQLFEPRLGCVAGDQGRVDRANRNSGDPIEMQVCLG